MAFLSLLRSLVPSYFSHPRLAPWAAFFRRFAAVFLATLALALSMEFDSHGSLEAATIQINSASSFIQNAKGSPLRLPFVFGLDASYCAAGLRRTGAFLAAGAAGFELSNRPFSITIMKGLEVYEAGSPWN